MNRFFVYQYSEERCDAYWHRQQDLGRIHLAVMLQDATIGEVNLKNTDEANHSCAMGIHLQNEHVKNCGYGTQAEVLALQYAFHEMQMDTVYADVIKKSEKPACFGEDWITDDAL